MFLLRKIAWIAPVVAIGMGVRSEACSVQVHYTQAQIDKARIGLYERDENLMEKDPTRFDEKHPELGQLLSNQADYAKLLQEFESHPVRFEHEYPSLVHVLEGDKLYHEKHPFPPVISPPPITDGNPVNPGNPGCPPSGNGPPTGSVPEPSTGVLMLSAVVVGLLGAASRRGVNRSR